MVSVGGAMTSRINPDAKPTRRVSNIERLLDLLRHKQVHRAMAVHCVGCKFPREGKRHGPCTCGAQQLDTHLRQALIDCGVRVDECPDEVRERLALCHASFDLKRHVSHFSTCPQAGDWRKPR